MGLLEAVGCWVVAEDYFPEVEDRLLETADLVAEVVIDV